MLNKSVAFTFLVYIIGFGVFAQTQPDTSFKRNNNPPQPQVKTYLSFSGGTSIPIRDFAAKELSNNASGFAVIGYNASVGLNWLFKHGFGVEVMYRYQSNGLDNQSLTEQYHAKYPTINFTTTSTPWKNNLFMIGSNNSFLYDKNSKLYIDVKFLVGLIKSTSFGITETGTQNGSSTSVTSSVTKGTGFGFCGGLGLKYEIAHLVFLGVNAEYFTTTIDYGNVTISSSGKSSTTGAISQKISTVNVNLFLTFRID